MQFRNIKPVEKGLSSFQFYFVVAIIGLIALIGVQRYWKIAEDTQRFSFEVLAHNFNTAVFQIHTRWLLSQSQARKEPLTEVLNDSLLIQVSENGWPISASAAYDPEPKVTLTGCYQLWISLLQNPEPISYLQGDPYGSRVYHLSLTKDKNCRYEMVTKVPNEYYFDYSPLTGQTLIHTPRKDIKR